MDVTLTVRTLVSSVACRTLIAPRGPIDVSPAEQQRLADAQPAQRQSGQERPELSVPGTVRLVQRRRSTLYAADPLRSGPA
jgi:hypothetical protein